MNKCAFCGQPTSGGYPNIVGGFTYFCGACPVTQKVEDETAEGDSSDEFGDFLRLAMQSFGIDPDAWLEDQDRLDRERAAEA
jgi:hypothetical protein